MVILLLGGRDGRNCPLIDNEVILGGGALVVKEGMGVAYAQIIYNMDKNLNFPIFFSLTQLYEKFEV